ncbi:hypothetical protein [Leuconostoc mesenteroides]|uniref:hypothetical protein n=1 Tax=Leuconostoc mesenteroides TaxID=1245 RepID=UPI000A03BC26|nr:hypothetical protein [Leuconostoc mesenteroides]ORI40921.1 hypothetical protein BMR93_08000 [Leuconostoc mesenteroides subsp. cremoris]
MAITMYTSDRAFVTPREVASVQSAQNGDTSGVLNRGKQLKITVNGLTATVDTGQALILGRLVEVVTPTSITLPAHSNGKLCIVIDIAKENAYVGHAGKPDYYPTINQVYLAAVTGELIQEDINNGGYIYELPLATFSTNSTTGTVSQHNPVFNDTGWRDLELAHRSTYNPEAYARYRVFNGICYLRWYNIACFNSQNGNQVFKLPRKIKPHVKGQFAIAGSNININNGNHQFCNFIVPDVDNPIEVVYGMWGSTQDMRLTGATGSGQYPLGGDF